MGGHLALRALAEARISPKALVLTAPMLGLHMMHLPLRLVAGAARLLAGFGDRRRPAWGPVEKPGAKPSERNKLLTHDDERYADEEWWRQARPFLQMGAPSWGWLEQAFASLRLMGRAGFLEAVKTPVQLFACNTDGLVDSKAIVRAASRMPQAELVKLGPEAAHEILREVDAVRLPVWAKIDAFFNRVAAAQPG